MTKNSTPIIRAATQKDAEHIARIHICSWQEMYKEFIPESVLQELSLSERTQQWHDLIKQGTKVLVLENDNEIIGFASICPLRDQLFNEVMGEISAIYLHPDYWRLGLGSELCRAALSELSSLGYKTVCLWVLSDNAQARGFYEAFGFKLTDVTKMEEFYDGGALLEEVLYKKTL